MNKFLSLLFFIVLFGNAASAQQSIITFKSLGRDDDAITGMSGSSAYYVKIDPFMEMNGSKLVLFFEPSQALIKDKSYINVLINDKPVYSARLSKDSIQKVTLGLSRADLSPDRRYVKIQIRTLLTITDDICHDLDNPAMWLKVKGNSYLALNKSNTNFFNNVNISNSFESKTAIVYPANPTLHDLKAVAWAYARLKKSDIKNVQVVEAGHLPDTIHNYIMVGSIGQIAADKRNLIKINPGSGQGLFYLHKAVISVTDTVTNLVTVNGQIMPARSVETHQVPEEILFVTGGDEPGYEKTITALGNMNILNSTFGDYLLINNATNNFFKTIDENRSKLTLRQLGGLTNFASGVGSLKTVYNFKNSDFSFTPKEVEIRFVANYSALALNDRGYFNVYLNGMLISSEKLDASGKLNTSVTINRYQHHKYNTLIAEFRFHPTSGNCTSSFTNFFAEIDVDKSYLESKNPFISNDLSFYQYPEAFNAGTTRIVVSRDYAKYAAGAMGEIIYELNNNINANNFPEFIYSDDLKNNKGDLKKYNIVALLSRNDPLIEEFPDAPIKFDHDFRLYNNNNNEVVYTVSDSVSNGLAQIFYGRSNNACLVLTATGKNLSNAFLAASRSITEQLSTLSSNVCIADVNNNKYLFNISKSSENLEYVDTKSALSRFWENYNLFILLGILILILVSFLYVRFKVQKSQEIINE
ncbi:cellulose biosynthesis cyclic di-GMP-binding regulatory protein BcsB [Mucilaginibacter jinjuensis]|uniref:Cellulose biosynthesis cyclic di-GMP-binding regulatory protein BcsB n=1 Tax=Mucilaginibacter jinjuensis TaxID=1176721 RepID=A0ABY7T7E7_9SPHI|nr:cellulose biosynthesis cyclic di-GMP-binding regulatory protein BcsB [Mucilaginibacter jinjuensis]WCT11648.1 cellulose biosynthesis cyclic di-GMP-binding regulatory protein BcsB [Mucilaginibacter jinjuensis]